LYTARKLSVKKPVILKWSNVIKNKPIVSPQCFWLTYWGNLIILVFRWKFTILAHLSLSKWHVSF
jgi:hypothetical protein